MKKKLSKPSITCIRFYESDIISTSSPTSPSEREHGDGPGNGKGWGPGGKPSQVFNDPIED